MTNRRPSLNEWDLKDKAHQHLVKLIKSGAPLWFLKMHSSGYQRVGTPDYLLCVAGRFAAVELKSPQETDPQPSPAQARELRSIQRAGGATRVINALAAFEGFVADLLTAAQRQPVEPVLPGRSGTAPRMD